MDMYSTLLQQYRLVQSSRGALLSYCERIDPEHFGQKVASFNNESIAGMMAHIATTYVSWLTNFAQQEQRPYFTAEDCNDLRAARTRFGEVDLIVDGFLQKFKDALDVPLVLPKREGLELSLSPLMLFTHVITHEFHHKGQIVNMSRQLGHTPVDTDIIRY